MKFQGLIAFSYKGRDNNRVNLVLPDSVEKNLTPAEAALNLALGLFVAERATLGQAAEIAGVISTDLLARTRAQKNPNSLWR
jgi:hypothetical protein